ncbi:MAG: DUF3368 domain-containing protein [Peptococcaceae bacterium]
MKKIVVSNTSPLIGLSQIGLIELPRNLWGKLYIPEAVLAEVLKKEPGHREIEKAVQEGWIIAKEAQNRTVVEALSEIFGPGESECLALAKEIGAQLLIIDEQRGRKMAKRLGLKITGVVGMLVMAMQKDMLAPEELGSSVELLQKFGFRLSKELILRVKEEINNKLCQKK